MIEVPIRQSHKSELLLIIIGAPVRRSERHQRRNSDHFYTDFEILHSETVLLHGPGTFIIGKSGGGCRWATYFRGPNKCLKRRAYPIPKIHDLLQGIQGYEWTTKLDVSMQFCTFELDEESKDLTTFATPFSLFQHTRCPMGATATPDLAQEAMELPLA